MKSFFYYSSIAHALYMAKEFGVGFTLESLVVGKEARQAIAAPRINVRPESFTSDDVILIEVMDNSDHQYNVHHNSLEIIDPALGDVMMYHRPVGGGGGSYLYEVLQCWLRHNQLTGAGDYCAETIFRDNKAFIMPKRRIEV